ncbi:putative bifunctional diguanylate cyclase/phosphodiesterase [Litchfieldia alkalitelluris]|uniref:putative bifunctional diguanylate cyclase/phosphodiesterase n=1 Tax=Litchfieldia alkalitelluris TaxID=304268 RepID=UPI00099842D1|nr:EAL domain-containing protein [Litchfieldia alkalitelluris]
MYKNKNFKVLFGIILIIASFYIWNIAFREHEWVRVLGASFFPTIGGAVAFIFVFRAFQKISGKQKYFWMLLSIGTFLNFASYLIWFYLFLFHGANSYPNPSLVCWLLGYFFYFLALVYKAKIISTTISENSFLFNIIIFMIIAIVISLHFLIEPLLALANYSLGITFILLVYPLMNLGILYAVIYLYYLSQYSNERKELSLINLGFILQILADTSYIYLTLEGRYEPGSLIDPLWLIAILMIGFASFYAYEEKVEINWTLKKSVNRESIFPYISIIILIVLVINSYQWNLNTLSIGVCLIFIMVIIRQLLVINRNRLLMVEYRDLAYHDPLTGLNNRTSFHEELEYKIDVASRTNSSLTLLLIDLDRFKLINDTLGHFAGDLILIKSAERLKSSLSELDQVYRLGGDEFILILPGADRKRIIGTAQTILNKFSRPFIVANHEITITPSIGISSYPDHGDNSELLFKNADAAMYLAKGSGKNNFRFFNKELNEALTRKMKIESELRKAVHQGEFTLFYQPIMDLTTRQVIAMEALIRWKHPELGYISPAEFIPVAEETGQIVSIGEWVLKTACIQNKTWQQAGFPVLYVSVNVSVQQFRQGDFVQSVKDIIDESGIDPQYLEIEITESLMQNIDESSEVLYGLKKLGVKTAIDDFGIGYSSLHILKKLPINTLKIDKSFIDDLNDLQGQSMAKTIINIGHNLNLKVVAEGIEHVHQVKSLEKYNCQFGQGYLFLKPVPAVEFEAFMKSNSGVVVE